MSVLILADDEAFLVVAFQSQSLHHLLKINFNISHNWCHSNTILIYDICYLKNGALRILRLCFHSVWTCVSSVCFYSRQGSNPNHYFDSKVKQKRCNGHTNFRNKSFFFICSAFFWLVSLLVSSLFWMAAQTLGSVLAVGLVFSVLFQELFRFFVYLLLRKAEVGLKKLTDSDTEIISNKHILAYGNLIFYMNIIMIPNLF